jgi:inosine-uridine nucleoside N-ribohydrolase
VDRIPVILDCDPGIDDAVALLLAVASPELDLRAVTTFAGNVGLELTTPNALRVLELAGAHGVPVAAGCARPLVRPLHTAAEVHGIHGLGRVELPVPPTPPLEAHAVELMAEVVTAAERPVTLVAVGPLTNVALLAIRHPDVAARLGRVIVMGGGLARGNVTPAAEFNVFVDPEAAVRVLDAGLDVTLVPLDATHEAWLSEDDIEQVRSAGPIGTTVAAMLDFYADSCRREDRLVHVPMHDPLALAVAFRPELVTLERMHVAVECASPLTLGATVGDRSHRTGLAPNAAVAVGADRPAFTALLVERLASLEGG